MATDPDRAEALNDIERFRELRRTQSPQLRDAMVLKYQPLAEKIARKYLSSGEPVEDLIQEGYLGLIKSVDRFDPAQGVQFNTYATHTITGEIRHYLRDLSKLIQEPGWHGQLRYKVLKCNEQLQQKLGRPPTPAELGQSLDMKEEAVRAVLQSGKVFQLESLDTPDDETDDAGGALVDRIAAPDAYRAGEVENRLVLRQAMRKLKKLERVVIYAFFYQEYSKTEIARKLGISVNYASYLVKRGLHNLKQTLGKADEQEAQLRLEQLKRELSLTHEELKRLDPLDHETGLASATRLLDRLSEELLRARRYELSFSMLLIEVAWPTEQRARVMKAVTKHLKSSTRDADLLARFDETRFLALLPHTGPTGDVISQRIHQKLSRDEHTSALQPNLRLALYPRDFTSVNDFLRWTG